MNESASLLLTPTRYGRITVLLHWLIALLIVAAFVLGTIMVDIQGLTPAKLRYFAWHKWLGVTVLALTAARLLWRLTHTAPPYAEPMPRCQQLASHFVHGLLYLLMFAVPLSGYFYSLAAGVPVVYLTVLPLPVLMDADPILKPILRELHETLDWILLGVVMLHVLAVMKHRFIDKDSVLSRMLP
jgi:cytochrome b561